MIYDFPIIQLIGTVLNFPKELTLFWLNYLKIYKYYSESKFERNIFNICCLSVVHCYIFFDSFKTLGQLFLFRNYGEILKSMLTKFQLYRFIVIFQNIFLMQWKTIVTIKVPTSQDFLPKNIGLSSWWNFWI